MPHPWRPPPRFPVVVKSRAGLRPASLPRERRDDRVHIFWLVPFQHSLRIVLLWPSSRLSHCLVVCYSTRPPSPSRQPSRTGPPCPAESTSHARTPPHPINHLDPRESSAVRSPHPIPTSVHPTTSMLPLPPCTNDDGGGSRQEEGVSRSPKGTFARAI